MSKQLIKRLALLILFFPVCFLLLFTIGETFSGDISGLGHLLQLAPLILVIFLAWKKPFIGGFLLIVTSIILSVWYLLSVSLSWQTKAVVELILFLPPFISGVLLVISAEKKEEN